MRRLLHKKWLWMVGTVLAIFLAGCGSGGEKSENSGKIEKIPKFEATGIDGKKYSSKPFFKGVGMITFVASWCGPCHYELFELDSLHKKFGKKLPVLALTYESPDLFEPIMDSLKISVPVAQCDTVVFRQFGVEKLPTRFLIEKGKIIAKVVGAPTPPDSAFTAVLNEIFGVRDSSAQKD